MRITAPAASLSNAFSLAAMACQRHGLATISADKGIAIYCTNPDITIRTQVEGNVLERGAASVSATAFGALISAFNPRSGINIQTNATSLMVERYRMPITVTPTLLVLDAETGRIEISSEDCLELLGVACVASTGAMRFYLNGVFFHNDGDQLVAVATDGTRLLRVNVGARMFSTDRTLVIPTKTTMALTRLIKAAKADKIELARSSRLFSARGIGFELTSRLIDAQYPNYQSIMPASTPNTVRLDRAELQGALARLFAVARGDFPLIALTWNQGEPLHVFLPRQPADGTDDIPAETKGSAKIALVPSQVVMMLGEFNCKNIKLNAAERLLISDGNNKLGLLMPCAWNFESRQPQEVITTPT